jgi:hypothetical protein
VFRHVNFFEALFESLSAHFPRFLFFLFRQGGEGGKREGCGAREEKKKRNFGVGDFSDK